MGEKISYFFATLDLYLSQGYSVEFALQRTVESYRAVFMPDVDVEEPDVDKPGDHYP